MNAYSYQNHRLYCESVPLDAIAKEFGTPCYVYSKNTLTKAMAAYQRTLADRPHLVCFAVKANSNLSILKLMQEAGLGFDVVSQGEQYRAQVAGADPKKIILSGVGKTKAELLYALASGIYCINVESKEELWRLAELAQSKNTVAPFALRINPDVDAKTHPYISTGLKANKFGIEMQTAKALFIEAKQHPHLKAIGVACHIGSQITDIAPFVEAEKKLLALIDDLAHEGITFQHIDMGGGLGITYTNETPPSIEAYLTALKAPLAGTDLKLIVEPGRSLIASAAVLLTRVEYVKTTPDKRVVVVDAAMNDYLRPALYGATQRILNTDEVPKTAPFLADIVGPICESADCFLKETSFSAVADDLLAICDVGAYGFSMASHYNSRPKPAEVLVDGDNVTLIHTRETLANLIENELSVLKSQAF